MKKSHKNNKLKISAPIWNEDFELPDGSYSVSDIQDYFIYFKTGYYLELLMPETMKLLESAKCKITKDKNGENVPHLEITEVVLIHCNIVNNDYQQDARVLYTFVPNKSFGQLLDFSPKHFIFLKTWFTD